MLSFFKKNKKIINDNENELLAKIACLLIHVARIDENYTDKEREIIGKTLLELGEKKENIDKLMIVAENNERNSNQILEFTKVIKNLNQNKKEKIIEALWSIIYSDKKADMYVFKNHFKGHNHLDLQYSEL